MNIRVFLETLHLQVLSLLTRTAHCESADIDDAGNDGDGLPVSFCKTISIYTVKTEPIED